MNVQGFEELKQVLSKVPQREFNISNWKHCACGHATHDQWFQRQGFTSCHNFRRHEELPRRSSVPSSNLSGRQQCARW